MQNEDRSVFGPGLSRRYFLQITSATIGGCALGFPMASAAATGATLSTDPRRPQFHLLPSHNWMNDPNGPIYFNGKYHMFFQYNPQSAVWGNMSWNHAVSEDLIHWQHQPVAFTMNPNGPDAAGCFSGSTLAVKHDSGSRVYAIYTGVVRDKMHETIRNEGLKESQCIAWSDDPLLKKWNKHPKPVIPDPPSGLHITGFRDPSVWKHGDSYLMGLGSGIAGLGGCVLLYRSTDLLHWEYLHPLIVGSWNGAPTSNPVDDGEMWECPEMFAVDGHHVLIYSSLRRVFWQSGDFDEATLTFRPRKGGLLDLGAFYAPKTQVDAKSRRILWGWIPERRSDAEMLTAGWSGMMSLPRMLNVDPDGTLRVNVIPELSLLRREALEVQRENEQQKLILPNCTGEAECLGLIDQPMSLVVQLAGERLEINFDPVGRLLTIDQSKVALRPQDRPEVRLFVDGSVAEVVISAQITLTKRFYYTGEIAPDVRVTAIGFKVNLQGWNIAPISDNRLADAG